MKLNTISNKSGLYSKILLFAVIILLNGLLNCKVSNVIVTIPQILFVLFLLSKKDIPSAIFYHVLFFITSFGYLGSVDSLGNEVANLESFNYAKLRISVAPVFILISFLIIFISINSKYTISKEAKKTDFYYLFCFFKYIMISGSVMMLIGFAFLNYYVEGVMYYGIYALYVFVIAYMLLIVYKHGVHDRIFEILPHILIIGIIISTCSKFVSIAVVGSLVISYYGVLLLPMMMYGKNSLISLLVFCLFVYGSIMTSMGGKVIIEIVLVFIATFMLSFTSDIESHYPQRSKLAKILFVIVILSLPTLMIYIEYVATASDRSNFIHKLHSVQTMWDFMWGKNSIYEVDDSPQTRIAEFANIMYENVTNPIYMLFGRGFGGYYHDTLGIMGGLDLANGTYTESAIAKGEFYYAHDAFVSVPFMSGLIGVYMWIKCIVKYLKHASLNYYKLAVIPFLALIFFFDTQIGATGVVILFASESNLIKNKKYE